MHWVAPTAQTNMATSTAGAIKAGPIQFRLKPGYKTLWRGYRQSLRTALLLPQVTQRALTVLVAQLYRLRGLALGRALGLALAKLLSLAFPHLHLTSLPLLCYSGALCLNAVRVTNPLTQVSVGDIVTCRHS